MIDFPVRFHIGHQQLVLHNILEATGIFVGMRYYYFLKRKQKNQIQIDTLTSMSILAGATLGAFIGSHILGSLENIPQWIKSADRLNYFMGNRTIVGGLLGGLFGVEISKKIVREKSKTGDLFTLPIIVALVIGRIGCFSAGIYEETYGLKTNLPWGMNLGDGSNRHPVTLYEIFFLIVLGILIVYCQRRIKLQQGATFKIFMISYLFFRFLLDFIKPGWRYFIGLGSIQYVCILGLIYYSAYIIHPDRLMKKK